MIWVVACVVVLFVLLSKGGRRVGALLLGAAGAANMASFIVAGITVLQMEPNFGPYYNVFAGLLVVLGFGAGIAGLCVLRPLGTWLSRPRPSRVIAYVNRVGLLVALAATLAATLQARGRPVVGPDLAPLVIVGTRPAVTVAGDLRVTVEVRPTPPDASTPRPWGWAEPDGICFVLIRDDQTGETYEAANLGKTERMSGSRSCPAATITVDASRRTVHLSKANLLGSTTSAWRFPGFHPTSTAIWTCRNGRLLATPREWLSAGWTAVAIAVAAAFVGALTKRATHGVGGARNDAALGETLIRASFAEAIGVLALSLGWAPVLVAMIGLRI